MMSSPPHEVGSNDRMGGPHHVHGLLMFLSKDFPDLYILFLDPVFPSKAFIVLL